MIFLSRRSNRIALRICGLLPGGFPKSSRVHRVLQGTPELEGRGILLEAGELLIDYLFSYWDFEKLCAECPEFNVGAFKSGLGGLLSEEGCLRNHERFLGRFWDLYLLAIYRDVWEERANLPTDNHGTISVLSLDEMGRAVEFSVFVKALCVEFPIN